MDIEANIVCALREYAAARKAQGGRLPYLWAGGSPPYDRWPLGGDDNFPAGYDCSGFVVVFARRVGVLSHQCPRLVTGSIANGCVPVAVGQQRPGDFAFWNDYGHVGMVVAAADAAKGGHSWTLAANHGKGGSTPANDANGAVDFQHPGTGGWYGDVSYVRRKPDFYPPTATDLNMVAALNAVQAGASAKPLAGTLARYYQFRLA